MNLSYNLHGNARYNVGVKLLKSEWLSGNKTYFGALLLKFLIN